MIGSIIGSFRKYYNDILNIIECFEEVGIKVLSPKKSYVIDPNEEFVYLNSDRSNYCPVEIQLITFHRILRSDFVYVWNPNGYIGRTTCYEIGRIIEKNIPIYFKNIPNDLPLFLHETSIIEPGDFVKFYQEYSELPKFTGTLSTNFAERLHNDLIKKNYNLK